MLTSKQRSYLKKMSAELSDTIYIGKDGLTENMIRQAEEQLAARELVKGKIQQNSAEEVKIAAQKIADATGAQVVATIGRKFILFRQKTKDSNYTV